MLETPALKVKTTAEKLQWTTNKIHLVTLITQILYAAAVA